MGESRTVTTMLSGDGALHVGGIYRGLFEAASPGEVFERGAEGARLLFGADLTWCLTLVGDTLAPAASSGWLRGEIPSDFHVPAGEGVGGRIVLDARTVIVRDYQRDPRRIMALKTLLDEEGVRSGVVAPIPGDVGCAGVLYVAWRRLRNPTEDDAAAVTRFARDLGAAAALQADREALADQVGGLTRDLDAIRDTDVLLARVAQVFVRTGDLAVGLAPVAATLEATVVVDASGFEVVSVGPGPVVEGPHPGPVVEGPHPGPVVEGPHPGDPRPEPCRVTGELPLAGGVGSLRLLRLRPVSAVEKQLLGRLANLVALQLLRERTEAETEMRVRGQLLDDILTADGAEAEHDLLRRAALLGVELKPPRFVACVGPGGQPGPTQGNPPPSSRLADTLRHVCRIRRVRPLTTWREGHAVLLFEGGPAARADMRSDLVELMAEASALLGGVRLVAGLGLPATSVADYRTSFSEATSALELAQAKGWGGRVLPAEDLGLYGLLAQATRPDALRAIAERALGPLLEPEEKSRELLRTLVLYLENDRNAERTAAALHVHVNTLRYRVGRIEDLLGVDLRDVDTRFLLELAVRVHTVLDAASDR